MITTKFIDSPYKSYVPYSTLKELEDIVITASHDSPVDYSKSNEWRSMFGFRIDDAPINPSDFNARYCQEHYPPGKRTLFINRLGFEVTVMEADGNAHVVPHIPDSTPFLTRGSVGFSPQDFIESEPGKLVVLTISHNSEAARRREIASLMTFYKRTHKRYSEDELHPLFSTMSAATSAIDYYGVNFEKNFPRRYYADSGIKEIYTKTVVASAEDFQGVRDNGQAYKVDKVFDINTGILVTTRPIEASPPHPSSARSRILGSMVSPDYEDYNLRVELIADRDELKPRYLNVLGYIAQVVPKDTKTTGKPKGLYIYHTARVIGSEEKIVKSMYYPIEELDSSAPAFETMEQARKSKDLEIERLTDRVQALEEKIKHDKITHDRESELLKLSNAEKDEVVRKLKAELLEERELLKREARVAKTKFFNVISERLVYSFKFISGILMTVKPFMR